MNQPPDLLALDPLADEDGGGYGVYVSDSSRVRLTPPLRYFLAACRADGRIPVLVTGADSSLGPHVVTAMRISGGTWAARTADGVYDGLRGFPIDDFADLGRPLDLPAHPQYLAAAPPERASVMFEVVASRRAEASTAVGGLAGQVIAGLGGEPPDRWGLDEPLTFARDDDTMTASLRAQMPASEPHLLGAPDGSFAAISVARTKHGLLERVRGGVPAGRWADGTAALAAVSARTLTELERTHRVTSAFVSVAPTGSLVDGDCQRPGARAPEQPIAVLLGPRAVHDLRPDVTAMRKHLDVTELGRARLPSLLLQVPDGDGWASLAGAVGTLDPEQLLVAVGIDGAFLDRMASSSHA